MSRPLSRGGTWPWPGPLKWGDHPLSEALHKKCRVVPPHVGKCARSEALRRGSCTTISGPSHGRPRVPDTHAYFP